MDINAIANAYDFGNTDDLLFDDLDMEAGLLPSMG
jgi:hypothetical protein